MLAQFLGILGRSSRKLALPYFPSNCHQMITSSQRLNQKTKNDKNFWRVNFKFFFVALEILLFVMK